jgi:hypothetical protein
MLRSGVIAKKLGMTRLFMEDGKQIPVTVLQLDKLQVVAQRTRRRPRLCRRAARRRLGQGQAGLRAHARPLRQGQCGAQAQGREFRVDPENLLNVGEEIIADHYFEGQFVDVTGTSIGKGFAGAMKRHNFGGLRASHGVSISPPLARLDRSVSGPGPRVQGQEDGRPHGRREGDDAEPAGRAHRHRPWPDHDQGRGARIEGWLGHDQGRGEKAVPRERDPARSPALRR